jgi:hypothetical protein
MALLIAEKFRVRSSRQGFARIGRAGCHRHVSTAWVCILVGRVAASAPGHQGQAAVSDASSIKLDFKPVQFLSGAEEK